MERNEVLSPAALTTWLIEKSLAGVGEAEMVGGFCERLVHASVPLARAIVLVDTLHPIYEGRAYRWNRRRSQAEVLEYGRTRDGPNAEAWRRSPLYYMIETNQSIMRRRLTDPSSSPETPDFATFVELRNEGMTDYVALVTRFAPTGVIGEMDAIYSFWTSDVVPGFDENHIAMLQALINPLAAALKCASLAGIAATLVETYLGRDAGRRVLSGRIERGVADRISAVLWYSDLRGYTRITDTVAPDQIIPLLNDYADVVISAIHEAGGDVLKLIGDGTLAIFRESDIGDASHAALNAAVAVRRNVIELNVRRANSGLPSTDVYLGLHVGEVFYGNVGSLDRLDFTVVGPAVNEVSRIAAMCRSVERDVLLSAAFVSAACPADRHRLVSVGRYALRGIARAQELYTLDF
ncbi:MAG: adenylate/guanylate cyclase domain-containing protein [Deltaproteobacteria bacterium]|nr:adenylate/guanylate cyclase domain-containing protein [Deltaproteobacteria bacterium]